MGAEALYTSQPFKNLLGALLAVINTMSPQPIHGFKFSYIDIAKGIKTGDGSSNLLKFALETLLKSPKYQNFIQDLKKDMMYLETCK